MKTEEDIYEELSDLVERYESLPLSATVAILTTWKESICKKQRVIQKGDTVIYIENKLFPDYNNKCIKTAMIGIWNGEFVQFDDKEKTLVRNKEYLVKLTAKEPI